MSNQENNVVASFITGKKAPEAKVRKSNEESQKQYVQVLHEKTLKIADLKHLKDSLKKENKTKRVNLLLTPSLHSQIAVNAKDNNESINSYIMQAILDRLILDERKS